MNSVKAAEEAVVRAAMRWRVSYAVGLDLSRMKAPAYLCGASADSIQTLFAACARLAALRSRKGK